MALFNKILIANRGEIACRIIKTARKLGIKTVAVYSEVDANALHVKEADEAYLLGPSPSSMSYLNHAKILQIAHQSKAEAIHPGYGFLSEKVEFAKACEDEGIVFIGPSSQAIQTMGEKHLAKEIMRKHQIPVLPDYYSKTQEYDELCKAAHEIGFPLLIKAVAGGGGKGLRLVKNSDELNQAIGSAKREAKASFNDERLLIEKYLDVSRHIEVQIIADNFHNVVHLFERDCSTQRKHQKIIEEAPAINISANLKAKMYKAAIQAAKAINYTNAGTVEFLVSSDEQFYFMEMNTRLQVEHPVTEMITGVDVVEWQIRVAANEKLPATQEQINLRGHAIEVRLNAEDASKDFMPATGKISYLHLPEVSDSVRIDIGYREQDYISIYYDSLLAKLIAYASDRSQAIALLHNAMKEIKIAGITTNLFFLQNIIQHPSFQTGQITTQFLTQTAYLSEPSTSFYNEAILMAALALRFTEERKLHLLPNYVADANSPWFTRFGWQLNLPSRTQLHFLHDAKQQDVSIIQHKRSLECIVNDSITKVEVIKLYDENNLIHCELKVNDQVNYGQIFVDDGKFYVFLNAAHYIFKSLDSTEQHDLIAENTNQLRAPMPGTIVEIMISEGQKVVKGQKLLVIEAMKMEHIIHATKDGVIQKCHYAVGDSINEGSELLEICSEQEIVE